MIAELRSRGSRIEAIRPAVFAVMLLAAQPAIPEPRVLDSRLVSPAHVQPDPRLQVDHITKAALATDTVWLLDLKGRLSYVPLD